MAPAMKLTLKWEEGKEESAHMTLKLTLPRKWKEGPTIKLKETFVESYNSKHPDAALQLDKVHLLNSAGHALGDEDIVFDSLTSGDHVRIKPGPAPTRSGTSNASKAGGTSAAVSIPTPAPQAHSKGDNVSSAAALEAAKTTTKAFDYSKWDRLDLSDDDGDDCHPNIDKASWKRLMAQKREDRRSKEEEKIKAYQSKIDKYTSKVKEIQAMIDSGNDDPQLTVDIKDAQDSAEKYQAKLDHFNATRKLTADDLCEVDQDYTVVAESAEVKPIIVNDTPSGGAKNDSSSRKPTTGPAEEQDEGLEYDVYIKKYRKLADTYANLRSDEQSEAFLFEHPQLLHEHNEGFLLLRTLDVCMRHLDEKEAAGGGVDRQARSTMESRRARCSPAAPFDPVCANIEQRQALRSPRHDQAIFPQD